MEKDFKATVRNTTKHGITVLLPDLKFSRTWPAQSVFKISMEILHEAAYDTGFKKFIDQGLLFIEEKEARVELGLEEEGEDSPIKILNHSQILKLLRVDTAEQLKETLQTLSHEQRVIVADTMIEEKILDFNKAAIVKEFTSIDPIKAIQLNALDKE